MLSDCHPNSSKLSSGVNFVELLPRELSLLIFSMLSPVQLCALRCVARKWKGIADDDSMYGHVLCLLI